MGTSNFRGQAPKNQFVFAAVLGFLIFTSLWWNHDRLLGNHEIEGVKKDKPKYAFATLLAGPSNEDEGEDHYFVATRILAYQLLHHPDTKSRSDIPFLVGVSQNYSEAKRERLRKDGATVIEVDPIHSDWIKPLRPTYVEVLSKLRFWELEEYDRICILDGDGMLTRPLDGVFDDPSVEMQETGQNREASAYHEDEGPLPTAYAFASSPESAPNHGFPPTVDNNDFPKYDYLNAGFLVFRPDKRLFAHYMKILSIPDRFDSSFPEQNLLNYVHRKDGNMPWKTVGNTWNINFPNMNDVKGGVASMHEKFWSPAHEEMAPFLQAWRYRMEGYFEAKDEELR